MAPNTAVLKPYLGGQPRTKCSGRNKTDDKQANTAYGARLLKKWSLHHMTKKDMLFRGEFHMTQKICDTGLQAVM